MSKQVKVGYSDGPWHQGEDVAFVFPIVDAAGAPVNCSTFALIWLLVSQAGAVVHRWSGGSITTVNANGTSDGVKVTVTDAETIQQSPAAVLIEDGLYRHELWRVDEGNERMLAYGGALLRPSRRRQETS